MDTPLFPEAAKVAPPSSTTLKRRVAQVKESGRIKGRHIELALAARPSLDTIKGGTYIHNVWNMRVADQELTEAWEQAAGSQQSSPQPSPALVH